ncbi:serine/threonine-protein kinase [Nocardia sp. XZ_19_231]|uniref:serine/threonine-protein kinase n=1 Tax=Nocardia sp. XZ_19_231 TaxID=2769252 RepID=UPI00188E7EBC|nr:serine/threonine-protein kinase [Nocardia sp. XZ_19_231]
MDLDDDEPSTTRSRDDVVAVALGLVDALLGELVAVANSSQLSFRGDPVAYKKNRIRLSMILRQLDIEEPFPFATLEAGVAAAKARHSGKGSWAARRSYFNDQADPVREKLEALLRNDSESIEGLRSFTDSDGAVWRYDPAEVIGSGGAGVVYRGVGEDGTAVAVKRVELGLGGDLAARIHGREIEIGKKIGAATSHDHLLVNLGVALGEESVNIVMPLADTNLEEYLAQAAGPLPMDDVVPILRAIALGLQELAEIGVVHRDLKPANILRVGNCWRLADFGIARDLAEHTASWTRKGEGTTAYMAPEYIENGIATARTDLYALGVIAFELLTGARPFTGHDSSELRRQHLESPPPAMIGAPEMMQRLVYRLLAKDPAARQSDARAVVEGLEAVNTPLTALQQRLASVAVRAQRAQDAEHAATARADHQRQKRADEQTSALVDLNEMLEQALELARTVLGDEVTLKRTNYDDVGDRWVLSWRQFALVVAAETGEATSLNPRRHPLLVGSLASATPDPRHPSNLVGASMAANLIYFRDAPGWVTRVWWPPFIFEPGGMNVNQRLWNIIADTEGQPLESGFSDTPLTVEALLEPWLELLGGSAPLVDGGSS